MATQTKPIAKIKRIDKTLPLPKKHTEQSACYDLYAAETKKIRNINVEPPTLMGTGIALDIPAGYHAKVFLRSSTGLNGRIRLANQVGIIDSDYKDEIKLILENNSREVIYINKGDRIAQFLIEANVDIDLKEADKLGETKHKGLGSTGKK